MGKILPSAENLPSAVTVVLYRRNPRPCHLPASAFRSQSIRHLHLQREGEIAHDLGDGQKDARFTLFNPQLPDT